MDFEYLYPDAAQRMLVHIDDVIHTFGTDTSEDGIMRMSDELARRTMLGNTPPRGHNNSTLHDLARLLILHRLVEQGIIPVFPFSPFFFFPPFVPVRPRPPARPTHPPHPIRPPMRPR